eukprot:13327268-Heterocapsa_arctica.AAC.1
MDEDNAREEENNPSDTEDDEAVEGAQKNDMSRFERADIIKWMENNPEKKQEAAMEFDKELVKTKKITMT